MKNQNLLSYIVQKWDQYFFTPTSPASLGLFRILLGTVAFLSVLGKYPYRNIFYGEDGVISNSTMNIYFPDSFLYFRFIPGHDPALQIYFLVFLLAIFCLIIGFQSRIASVLVFLGLISLSNRNMFVENSGDNLLRINAFFLMFAPCGAAYSIDRLILRWRGKATAALSPISPWVQRLLQLQLGYLYLETAYTKAPGQSWQDGSAIYYALNYLEIRRFDFTWVFDSFWKIQLATYFTLILEFAIALLIWFRPFRYYILAGAAGLHITFNILMQFPVFQFVMLASLVNFICPEDIEKFFGKIGRLLKQK